MTTLPAANDSKPRATIRRCQVRSPAYAYSDHPPQMMSRAMPARARASELDVYDRVRLGLPSAPEQFGEIHPSLG